MTNHISETILNKIQKENIKPKARWYFLVEHAALWVPGVVVTLLGALAVAGELFAITHSGREYREFIYASRTDFILANVPLLWAVSFIIFGALIVKALRTTHTGYRYSTKAILIGSLATSIIVGAIFFKLDSAFDVDSVIRYPVHEREQRLWGLPEHGRLAGSIETTQEDILILRDKDNVLWSVDLSGFGTTTFPFVVEGKSIRIIGTSTALHSFTACAVFPWDIGMFTHPPMQKNDMLPPPPRAIENKNPDCKVLLENIKVRVREGERNQNMFP